MKFSLKEFKATQMVFIIYWKC